MKRFIYFSLTLLVVILITTNKSNADESNTLFQGGSSLFGGSVGLAFPMGEDADVFSSSLAFQLRYHYFLMSQLMLAVSVNYITWAYKDEFPQGIEYSSSSIPILVAAQYILAMKAFQLYFGMGVGLHHFIDKYTYKYGDMEESDTQTDDKFMIKPQIGLLLPLTAMIILNAQLSYNLVFHDNANFTYAMLTAGILIGL